jgi:hypothetical protein
MSGLTHNAQDRLMLTKTKRKTTYRVNFDNESGDREAGPARGDFSGRERP